MRKGSAQRRESRQAERSRTNRSTVVTARFPTTRLTELRRLYPGQSNQEILMNLADERLARKEFTDWVGRLQEAADQDGLDLDAI
jgi:hypothetical protein